MTTQKSSRFRRVALAVAVVGAVAACGDSATPAAGPAASAPAAPTPSAAPASPTPGTSSPTASPDGSMPAAGLHMIVSGGRRLAFHVTPGHSPTLVLDAGGGEDSSYWDALVPKLSQATGSRIVTYDRAGMGASDDVKGPWDGRAAAVDLRAGLRELGVTRDVVLVSHSQAGEVATYFARADPGVLAGAVLVDANLPQFFTDAETARLIAMNAPQIAELEKQPSTKATRQLLATAADFGPTHRAYHRLSWPDSVPATVIVSAKTPFDGSPPDARLWREAAAAFVVAGPGRTLVTARGSSHDVPRDKPALVVDQVTRMAAAVR